MSDFKPDGNGGFTWKVKQAEFQGYMRGKMEEHDKHFKNITKDINGLRNKVDKNKDEIGKMKVWSAIIGGGAGTVGGFLRGLLP